MDVGQMIAVTMPVGEHDEQQWNITTTHGAHDSQNAALKGMPRADDPHRTWKVAEMGSVWWLPLIISITTS